MSTLVIQRKYGHKNAGHETFEWNPLQREVAVKEIAATPDDIAKAEAAFYEAMAEPGAFALMKALPTDKEYIPVTKFDPTASEIIVNQGVYGG